MKNILSLTAITLSLAIPNVYARDNTSRDLNNTNYSNSVDCYITIKGRCFSRQEYQRYLNYAYAAKQRIQGILDKLLPQYNIQNGRIRQLPNGRYIAKENDKEYINQEVVCSSEDYLLKGKTSCYACETGYQNTLGGAFGGKDYFNNPYSCSVHKLNNNVRGHINVGDNFDATSAIVVGAVGTVGAIGAIGSNNGGGNSGSSNVGSGGGMGGGVGGNMATEAFACLEYYTNSNGTSNGGEHLKYSENMAKCMKPMNYYYNNLESYYCTYAGCYYLSPATIMIRKMWLYTNPYIYIGNTMRESDRIAESRTNTSTYGSWKQIYVYPN